MCNIQANSTPHASPGNGAANQAGSFCVPKPPLDYRGQVELMESRGLRIDDEGTATRALSELNYYRLRGYWLTFEGKDGFLPGTSFDDILDAYRLDTELRHWVWSALEPIELKARTSFAYHLSMACGPMSYADPSLFANEKAHARSMRNVTREIEQAVSNRTPCVIHNLEKYGALPIWAAVEVMTFGTVSQLYGNLGSGAAYQLGETVAKSIAEDFGLKPAILKSWLRHMTFVRNICGHHSRLYNRTMTMRPKLLGSDTRYAGPKQFPTLLVLMRTYQNSWPDAWPAMVEELAGLIDGHHTDLCPMGFPEDWRDVLVRDWN